MFKSILNKIKKNKEIKQRQNRLIEICLNQEKDCPEYFYEMMRLKLENLIELSNKQSYVMFDPKYVRIAIKLCKLLEENKMYYLRPINIRNYKNYDECKDWNFNTKKVIDYDIMDDLVFKFDVSKKLQADFYKIKAKNILFKIIKQNILYWCIL
jgi:hypothetical protein